MALYSVNLFLQTKSECFEKDIYIYRLIDTSRIY